MLLFEFLAFFLTGRDEQRADICDHGLADADKCHKPDDAGKGPGFEMLDGIDKSRAKTNYRKSDGKHPVVSV